MKPTLKEEMYRFEDGSILTGLELCLLDSIISKDSSLENYGTYEHDIDSDEIREALDMLVLSGIAKREKCEKTGWKNKWHIIPEKIEVWKNTFQIVSCFIPIVAEA